MTIDTCPTHIYTQLTEDGECPDCKALGGSVCSSRSESDSSRLGRTLFVYASGGDIRCLSVEETQNGAHMELEENGWKHTATIDPRAWIEALMRSSPMDATSMMDELNFGPF